MTFVTSADRVVRAQRARGTQLGAADALLAATSCVVALVLAFTAAGRLAVFDAADRARGAIPIDLRTVDGVNLLERGLAPAFPDAADRQFAARTWFRALTGNRANGRTVPSVGAAAAVVAVSAEAIEAAPHLDVYARRLAAARAAGRPVTALPLFTQSDLSAMKASFVVRTRAQFRRDLFVWGALYLLAFHGVSLLWRLRRVDGDRLLLAAAHLVTGIGLVMLVSRSDPLRDATLWVRFAESVLIGLSLAAAFSFVDVGRAAVAQLSYLPLAGALGLCALLIAFGSGPGHSGVKVNLGPVQPIEAIRLLLAFFLAGYFARRWELVRGLRSRAIRGVRVPAWLDIPRGEYVLPVLAGVGVALALFAIQKDLGPALLLCVVFLIMYAVARGRVVMPLAGFGLLIAGFYVGNLLHVSRTLSDRVGMWESPWNNAVPGGDQVAHAIWAMASGGSIGTGVGLGDSRYLPAGYTDLVLAAVGEELGLIGLITIAAAYAFIVYRGFRTARESSTDYGFFLATALTIFLIVPVLVMAAGIVGVIPLTGVVTPFLSYGGSAMAANFTAVGILSSIHGRRRQGADLASFDGAIRWLNRGLILAACALAVIVVDIQVVHADDYLVRPHLGVQADGGRRYVYNPRVLDAARQIPRGSVFDRRGLPLATDDPAVIEKARGAYQKLGIALDTACPSAHERCYPLGARAFHVLGDARTHANWSAPNTSYVERDEEATLRGYDDHAAVVATTDAAGRSMSTIRRDYREIVPLVRHRFEPDHPAVAAIRSKARDVHLTIDAALQLRVAAIVESPQRKRPAKRPRSCSIPTPATCWPA